MPGAQTPHITGQRIILHKDKHFFVTTAYRPGQTAQPLRRQSLTPEEQRDFALQEQSRIASSITRPLPKLATPVEQHTPFQRFPVWLETFVVIVGLLVAGIAHADNMFNYPQYGLDEGTYMASAWAITHGMLFPYPYGYGHPPLGWIQIAAWVQAMGGFFAFGNAINTGRVLMLVFAIASTLLVYLIARCLERNRIIALLAMVLFALSPLCITYQRLVLLDNIATFWLLLSLYLIVASKSRLLFMVLAAVAFGCSLLSKEVMLLFLPVMVYAVWLYTTSFQRKFALVAFGYCIVAIGSAFVLMAILRGELLPTGWLPWDSHAHLSLVGTYVQQVQRGQTQGNLLQSFITWREQDTVFLTLAIATTLLNLIIGWWNRKTLLLALLALSFWLLFLRNGIVFSFYIIPLLPLSVLNIVATLGTVTRWLRKLTRSHLAQFARVLLVLCIIAGIGVYDIQHAGPLYTQNLTFAQTDALTWIRDNVPRNAVVVINSYFYTDLHENGGEGVGNGATFAHADIYWNVAYDPELHSGLLGNNWDNIDYIVTDTPMKYDIQHLGGDMTIINDALNHAVLRADFRPSRYDAQDAIQIYQVKHKNVSPVVSVINNTSVMGTGLNRAIWRDDTLLISNNRNT